MRLCSLYSRAAVLGDKDALMESRHICMGRTILSLSTDHSSTDCHCRSAGSFIAGQQSSSPKPSDGLRETLKKLKEKIAKAKADYWSEGDKWKPKIDALDHDEATLFNTTLKDFQTRGEKEDEARNSVLKTLCPKIDAMETAEAVCGTIDGLLGLPL